MYTYLALGDSYTIGEQVAFEQTWPYLLTQKLKAAGTLVSDPLVIAKTGWTTDELMEGISKAELTTKYDMVSLLIGVNNQYRGRSLEEYALQFRQLLELAIGFASSHRVFVLSIPDWSVTPYAAGRNRESISKEIDDYNETAAQICADKGIPFINITDLTREAAEDLSLLTSDELHPSGRDYDRWAQRIVDKIGLQLA